MFLLYPVFVILSNLFYVSFFFFFFNDTATTEIYTLSLHDALPIPAEPKTSVPAPPPTFRLLLIEDHEDSRDMARHGLELLGQSVTVAADGETGIALALSESPDAVFVDIGLPGLDGYEVGRRLREALGDRVRLVALTGYGRADDRRRVREAGFDAHLVKPIVPTDMLKALRMLETKS